MKSTLLFLASLVLLITCGAASAAAQPLSTGVRIGASGDPDQFYFGGHIETPALVDRIHFRPNAEIGIGDGATLVAFNFEFAYKFRSRKPWNIYALAGPALNIAKVHDDTDAGGGFSIGAGVEHRQGLFGEFKIGFMDSPDFKIGVGYRFH